VFEISYQPVAADGASAPPLNRSLTEYICYGPKLITRPKTSPYSEYICSWRPAPPLSLSFFGFRCSLTCGVEVSSIIAPRAQAYPQRQRPWVIGSSPLASHGHERPRAPGIHHAATVRRGPSPAPPHGLKDFWPRKTNPMIGVPYPPGQYGWHVNFFKFSIEGREQQTPPWYGAAPKF
jgi:hypothetical protein